MTDEKRSAALNVRIKPSVLGRLKRIGAMFKPKYSDADVVEHLVEFYEEKVKPRKSRKEKAK